MTKIVNLFAGSGAGKSTTAAAVFAELKLLGVNAELIREYVKAWAWEGRTIRPYDQLYLAGKQFRAESLVYGKVDVAITDSPVLLAAVYERFYQGQDRVLPAIKAYLDLARSNGVEHVNIVLPRNKPFDPRGRYETEETAKKVDVAVTQMLEELGEKYTVLSSPDRERIDEIVRLVA